MTHPLARTGTWFLAATGVCAAHLGAAQLLLAATPRPIASVEAPVFIDLIPAAPAAAPNLALPPLPVPLSPPEFAVKEPAPNEPVAEAEPGEPDAEAEEPAAEPEPFPLAEIPFPDPLLPPEFLPEPQPLLTASARPLQRPKRPQNVANPRGNPKPEPRREAAPRRGSGLGFP
ncbi:MAG: hypothetical protein Q4G49_12775, partial [Paracoccus sp. (in: a-proteobacteria)]|nr:hypothetical protein [Paracoccus sp. (in: a-proteobacteria)]